MPLPSAVVCRGATGLFFRYIEKALNRGGATRMRFSKWVKFDQRDKLRNTHYSGPASAA
jgi:hypothetical protein